MIIGNLGIKSRDGCVEITLGAATPSRSVLFTNREVDQLCDLLRAAAKAKVAPAPADDILGDLM